MKAITTLLLLCFASLCSAQSWSALNDQFFSLYDKQEFAKAATVGEKAKLAAKKEFGEMHLTYATSLYNLAGVYLETGEYKKAEPLYLQAKTIQQKLVGDMHADYASTITDLATLYVETKQYAKAEPLYLQAKTISEKTNGKEDPEYITVIENLATLYEEMQQYEKAEPLFLEVNRFYTIHPGKDSVDLEASLKSVATLYDKMINDATALKYYLLLGDLYKQHDGEETEAYAGVINRLALLYTAMGEYEKAGPLYFRNAAIREKVYGDNHPAYASALNNIAAHYIDLGQYDNALPYYQQAIAIAEPYIKAGNTDYITYVNNFALLYMQMGQYDIAEPLLVKLVAVRKKISGENDPAYATSLNNLATIFFKTGQYEKAIPVYMSALAVIKKTIGEQNVEYASTLSNLGLLYATIDQPQKAEPLYLQSKAIRQKLSAENHPDYAALLDNFGLLYSNTGRSAQTKSLYITAKNIRAKLFGEEHPDYAVSLNNLAYYYMDEAQYDSAEYYFIKAKDIMKKTLGETHPSYGSALNNLSVLYMRTGQFKKAEPNLLLSSKIARETMRTAFTVLSETEKNNYLVANSIVVETNNSFLYRYPAASPDIVINNFNLQLALKSASLAATKNMIETLENSADTSIRSLFDKWKSNRALLAKQYSLPVSNRRSDIDKIEEETETQEKELTLRSSDFRGQENGLQVTTTDIQKKLGADEVAIEFVRFPLRTKENTDSVLYAAYILHKNKTVPDFVPLCEEKQLQALFDTAATTRTGMVNSFYRGLEIKGKIPGAGGKLLYRLIWQPLEAYLVGVKKISYAPAGKLYAIAFHALPVDSAGILADRYQLEQYISTRQLAFRNDEEKPMKGVSISLFGDASFSMDSLQLTRIKISKQKDLAKSATANLSSLKTRGNGVWIDLPGTATEVNQISQLFTAKNFPTHLYIRESASEENLKKLDGQAPPLLHIATHGFFLPELIKTTVGANTYRLSANPLLRSGIVLAGGNYAWSGKKPIDGVEDGIVTAYEISQLNLSNTELVVLSACETALGDVKGSEGVFGLQRAFKMAGVKRMIVSLWQVPDKETAELMTSFYTNCLGGMTVKTAFAQAQLAMRKKYAAYYWAAFVLVE